ncbi:ABC transporter substrate-binding protein [Aldersonia sp. NBC_00410]|uniref:ABC transporter substrate-binding protein n=1 Tax=Aldersonia sp. NBC_00410 TaxID=2975954 RepID=UPI00225A8395|nr:ABC transporter substrate-binding protein [Aldersonia sp. NBC_00410]MCX5043723.1 ABC transporter substrate-binding protein [Aldersonia sp. NBC_00410]
MKTSARRWLAAVTVTVALTAVACGDEEDPLSSGDGSSTEANSLVIGSANFPESETVADVYAEALRANGFDVSTKLNLGSREVYIPALMDGSIDLIPDYTGNLLLYLDNDATAKSADEVTAALTGTTQLVHPELALGTPAPGEDKDAVVVTRETADKWQLESIADLAPHSAEITFGAPAEFGSRPVGLPGLAANYGVNVSPANFVPIADGGGPATVEALRSGRINAADIFTTSPALEQNNFVVLADPLNNFPAQNVVPVMRSAKQSDKLRAVLDAVSAKLTTDALISLNENVSGDAKIEPEQAAKDWVAEQGLDQPIG